MAEKNQLKLTLVRSTNRRQDSHKACVLGLGLRRIHRSVIVDDLPAIRGMVNKVAYLLKIEELS